jgi:hypothetical protein
MIALNNFKNAVKKAFESKRNMSSVNQPELSTAGFNINK